MSKKIRIITNKAEVIAELNDSETAKAVWNALPIKGQVSRWGDEIYFSIPLHLKLENGRETVDAGDLAYWPDEPALCIFFGLTPISHEKEIRPASAVAVFGRVIGDVSVLKKVSEGSQIIIDVCPIHYHKNG